MAQLGKGNIIRIELFSVGNQNKPQPANSYRFRRPSGTSKAGKAGDGRVRSLSRQRGGVLSLLESVTLAEGREGGGAADGRYKRRPTIHGSPSSCSAGREAQLEALAGPCRATRSQIFSLIIISSLSVDVQPDGSTGGSGCFCGVGLNLWLYFAFALKYVASHTVAKRTRLCAMVATRSGACNRGGGGVGNLYISP